MNMCTNFNIICLISFFSVMSSGAIANEAFINLPHTDGGLLIAKLPTVSETESNSLFEVGKKSCASNCVTAFGSILGVADGAIGYSNCQSTCIKPEYSFMNLKTKKITIHTKSPENGDLHYIGVVHQCVEYARKWWMHNDGITFGSIDSAFEILYLTEGKNIYDGKAFPLARSINGSAKMPPKRGDLIIYGADRSNPNWRHGHVAVVVAVDLQAGIISIAEENYNNQHWENPKAFSRQLSLFQVGNSYTLLDIAPDANSNKMGAAISGWIYPAISD